MKEVCQSEHKTVEEVIYFVVSVCAGAYLFLRFWLNRWSTLLLALF